MNVAGDLYPWLQPVWQRLIRRDQENMLPHALLLAGPRGLGKAEFGLRLATYLLCRERTADSACGECKSCRLLAAGSHPDLLQIEPEEEGKAIKVDQVRQINHFSSQTAQFDGYKIIWINPADALNINAANALLKNLEEPSGQALFILVTEQPGRLPATIRSRCHQVALSLPASQQAAEWLKQRLDDDVDLLLNLANGAPLLALRFSQSDFMAQRTELFGGMIALQQAKTDPVELAQRWQAYDLLTVLSWLDLYLSDLIKLSLTGNDEQIKNLDQKKFLLHTVKQVAVNKLYLYKDQVQEARRGLLSGSNPNKILMLEDILLKWSRCITG